MAEERARRGRAGNEVRRTLEEQAERRARELEASELEKRLVADRVDVTLPADPLPSVGHLHLITKTRREIEDVFIGLGFNIAEGPEVETVYYNFDALNHAPPHPSRLMTDTFSVKPSTDILDPNALVLRVHTSPAHTRPMENQAPPIYIVVRG